MNPEPRFVVVATLEHLPNGAFLRVMVDGHGLVLARNGDVVHAFQGTCPHEKADLAQGRIEAGRLVCPRHGTIAVDAEAVRRNPPASRKVWDLTDR
jgi:nitrite reductase/ring-hydroxylating ferredoxin subunit